MANTIKIKNSGTANSSPSSLDYGELAINYSDGKLFYKNSSNTIISFPLSSGAKVTNSDTPPSSPSVNDIWFESDTGKTFIYYDSFWVEMATQGGPQGATGPTGATGATGASQNGLGAGSGIYISAAGVTVSAGTGTVARTFFQPIYIEQSTTFDRIAMRTGNVHTGTSTVRLGIYNNTNGLPSTVVLDAGTASCTVINTTYTITISQTLSAGWYWLASNVQAATGTANLVTLQAVPVFSSSFIGSTFSQTLLQGTFEAGITGAFATVGTVTQQLGAATLIALRKV